MQQRRHRKRRHVAHAHELRLTLLHRVRERRTEDLAALGEEGARLMERLLQLDPRRRITAAEALAHPFFDDVDRDALCAALGPAGFVMEHAHLEGIAGSTTEEGAASGGAQGAACEVRPLPVDGGALTTDRHGGFPTTDIPVRDVPGLAELAGPLLQSSIGK